MRILQGPNGCPWDREQTHESLRRFMLEETYECIDAINEGDTDHLYDELGDLLMNLCYDVFGSYALALNLSGMVGIGILVLLQYIVSAGKRERMRAEKSITPESKMAEAEKQETLP